MSQPPGQPTLRPSFCFNQTALRDFLRISRAGIDDTISQNLNALATPASTPFDPSSTGVRQARTQRQTLSSSACDTFKSRVLFPSWQMRSDVLNYCAGVATSPDPNDPDHLLRESEDARAREKIVDERLDPYGARNIPRQARTEALASLVRNERMVEDIIRMRTWRLVGERCEDDGTGADAALNEWRRLNVEGS